MFIHYRTKHKVQFIVAKSVIFAFMGLMLYVALIKSELKLPTIETKISFSIGVAMLILVGALAFANRLKHLFKIKSIGFLIVFAVLYFLKMAIPSLIWGVGLISIPLLVDDLIVNNYFRLVNNKFYWDIYKYKDK